MNYDILITGAGIVGLATAFRLIEKDPVLKIGIIEKESAIAQHQNRQ